MPAEPIQLLVNIDVPDLPEAIRFYSEALGLRVGRRFGEAGVEMIGASSAVFLLVKGEGSPAFSMEGAPGRSYRRHWTPVHLDILCADIRAAVDRACAAGARIETPISEQEWGAIAVLSDPFGHGFCLVQLTERGYDAVAT
jgi:predicted enzyme related to lactoylglutathione lyase